MKLLIVDDDPRMRALLKQVMAAEATEFCEAADGREAVAVYAAQRPDWVLMDVRMRPVNGLEATARIRARFPEARIILLSEEDEPSLCAAAREAGACGCVLKDDLSVLPALIKAGGAPGCGYAPFFGPRNGHKRTSKHPLS